MKIGFSKFCTVHPKWYVIAGSSGTHLLCVCTTHQNTILLVDALNWEDIAEQYKNHKKFINLCHHQQDLNMDAKWIFFATSHDKSPCDGVGGFVKCYVAKRSLQRPLHDHELPISA